MSRALNLLESIRAVNTKPGKKEDMDEQPYSDDSVGDVAGASGSEQDAVTNLEQKLSDLLGDLGLVSISTSTDSEDGSVYADASFEDGKNITLQFYVESGAGKVALLTDDSGETQGEIDLPSAFVNDSGELELSNLEDLPTDDIKQLVGQVVTVANQTEGFRRNIISQTSESVKKSKKRVINKLKTEISKLKAKKV
jgi:hypothetical protein